MRSSCYFPDQIAEKGLYHRRIPHAGNLAADTKLGLFTVLGFFIAFCQVFCEVFKQVPISEPTNTFVFSKSIPTKLLLIGYLIKITVLLYNIALVKNLSWLTT